MFDRRIYTNSFISLLSANMFFWMSVTFFLPVLPLYYHSLGMTDHQVGLAVGAYSVGAVLFRVFSGQAVDRYGSKPVLTAGIILSVLAIISYYYCLTFWPAMIARFLHGVGITGYAAAALTMVTLMHEESHTTEAVAVYALFTMFGVGFAASTAGWLFGFGALALVVVAGAVATLLSLLLFPRNPCLKVKLVAKEKLPIRTVAIHPGVWIPTLNLLAANLCFGSIMTYLPLLMFSHGVTEISLFYIAFSVAVILARFWVSRLCDWLTPGRLALYLLMVFGLAMYAVGTFVSQWVLVLAGAGIGIGHGLTFPVLAAVVTANTQPANRGTAFGFYTMAVDVGIAVGAIGMGPVAAIWGYQAVFIAAGTYAFVYAAVYRFWLLGRLLRAA
ncbi:MAG: MFS transporter [Negativicutes bacterium]|nr:MFS transporter [Negativicutes bacterium]